MKARLYNADLLRAIATVGVVVIHASHWAFAAWGFESQLYPAITLLARFSVPAFVVLTGVVLEVRYKIPPAASAFLRRRLQRTLLPWIVWGVVYFIVGSFLTHDIRNLHDVVTWWDGGAGHLYFLILIPQFYLLYLRWPRVRPWRVAAAALGVQMALDTYRLYGPVGPGAMSELLLWHGFELFPFWIGYFSIGMGIGRTIANGRRLPGSPWQWAAAIVVSTGLLLGLDLSHSRNGEFAAGTGAFLLPTLPPLVVSIVGFTLSTGTGLMRSGGRIGTTLRAISTHSLGIYIVHPLVLFLPGRLLPFLLEQDLPRSLIGLVVLTGTTVGLALLVSRQLARSPLAFTIGIARSPTRS